ncbi:MAG TPA: hypothetical protein VLM37_03215, partial [Fibrobacteraceae bacterium]|nr:hypothetical protein [Fibrobacteraceae bacterium]
MDKLAEEIHAITGHPLVSSLLQCVGGMFAVLNDRQQVLALNRDLLEHLGLDRPDRILGLRPGEFLGCCFQGEKGCGSGRACASCCNSQVLREAMAEGKPKEKRAILTVSRKGLRQDLALQVRVAPLDINDKRFALMFLQDVTQRQNWAALESTFFHDIGNMLSHLLFTSEQLCEMLPGEYRSNARRVLDSAQRVSREFA